MHSLQAFTNEPRELLNSSQNIQLGHVTNLQQVSFS